jgi:uncharacterized protein YbjT (DUF2867 family)
MLLLSFFSHLFLFFPFTFFIDNVVTQPYSSPNFFALCIFYLFFTLVSYMAKNILITSAAGKISKVLSPLVLKNGYNLRAFVHSEQSGEKFKQSLADAGGNLEIVVGDLENIADVRKALTGIDIVFHIGPSMHPREDAIGKIVINEAKSAGVSHFILSCVLHPVRTKLLNHQIKIAVEEYLIESRLPYTILQPAHFMQMTQCKDIADRGVMNLMWSFDVLQGYLDLQDYAEVALKIFRDPQLHDRATYELLGDNQTGREVARLIAKHSGQNIKCELFQAEVAEDMSEYEEDAFARLVFYYNRWGLTGNNNILRFMLRREPTSVEDYVVRSLKA